MAQLTIQEAARLSGVKEPTIRAWEIRYGAVLPERTSSRQRQFTFEAVERLKLLKKATDLGCPIRKAAELSDSELQALVAEPGPPHRDQMPFWQELEDYRARPLTHRLERLLRDKGPRDFIIQVAIPSLALIGQNVERGELLIAHEHLFVAIVRDLISGIFVQASKTAPKRRSSILLTTPEGDIHEIGILASACLCALRGFRTEYFGPNLPAHETARLVHLLQPELLLLGTTALPKEVCRELPENYISTVAASISQLNKVIRIVAGGNGLSPDWKPKSARIIVMPNLEALDHFLGAQP